MRGTALPRFSRLIGPAAERVRDPLARAIGALMIAVTLLAILTALGLVFDPRYQDFPFAPLSAAVVPFYAHSADACGGRSAAMAPPSSRRRRHAGIVGALHRAQ